MRSDTLINLIILITDTSTDMDMRSHMTDGQGRANYVAGSDTLIMDMGTNMRTDMTDGQGHVNYVAWSGTLCIIMLRGRTRYASSGWMRCD